MDKLKDFLKIIQLISILLIPISVVQYYFKVLPFFQSINDSVLSLFSSYTNMYGMDCSVLFLIIPWVLIIIITDKLIIHFSETSKKIDDISLNYKLKQTVEIQRKEAEKISEQLAEKKAVYCVINLIFSKFTISNIDEDELENKKNEAKAYVLSDLNQYRGKYLEDDEFDDSDTFAIRFFSQEDAINFVKTLHKKIIEQDILLQNIGFGLSYKCIVDVQPLHAINFYVLEFLEKAIRTVNENEICATSDFEKRSKFFCKSMNLNFVSKGTYIINKARVEISRINLAH